EAVYLRRGQMHSRGRGVRSITRNMMVRFTVPEPAGPRKRRRTPSPPAESEGSMTIRAVTFDVYSALYDTPAGLARALAPVLQRRGITCGPPGHPGRTAGAGRRRGGPPARAGGGRRPGGGPPPRFRARGPF